MVTERPCAVFSCICRTLYSPLDLCRVLGDLYPLDELCGNDLLFFKAQFGKKVLKAARAEGNTTPALFLTAKAEVADRVAGLDAGADDYLPKPFAASEFLARVRALTRRSSSYAPSELSFGNVTLDRGQYTLRTLSNEVRLNNKEYQLVELFLRHPHQVFSSEHLMEKIWGLDSEADMDVVWTYIGFLRRKLKQVGADIEIRTIRGAGYALEEMRC